MRLWNACGIVKSRLKWLKKEDDIVREKYIKCPECGRKSMFHYNNGWHCVNCGREFTQDMEQLIRWSYICPRCGNDDDLTDNEPHICSNCSYEHPIKTEYTSKEVGSVGGSKEIREFIQIQREKYTLHSDVFDEKLYQQLIDNEAERRRQFELQRRERELLRGANSSSNLPRCPKCGSTAITAGQRGFSFWTGFIGSGNTVNRCSNCGYKWKP